MVCHANTARSVMAHVLLERMLARHGADGAIRVRSGGIANYARDGMIASLDARLALREEGIHLAEDAFASTDLKRHRHLLAEARQLVTARFGAPYIASEATWADVLLEKSPEGRAATASQQ
jgi:hypothetical protein